MRKYNTWCLCVKFCVERYAGLQYGIHVQHVTVLNTVGNCDIMVLYYYNLMGPPS